MPADEKLETVDEPDPVYASVPDPDDANTARALVPLPDILSD
jgi:hypothetical protein